MLYFWTVGNGIPSDSMTFLIRDVYIGQNSIPKEPRILAILATLSTSINPPILSGYGIESSCLMNFDPMPDCQQLCNKSCTHKAAQAIMRNAARFSRIQVEQQPPLPQGLIAMCNYVWLTIESLWIPCATLEDPGGLLGVFAPGFPGISVKWCTFWTWFLLTKAPAEFSSKGKLDCRQHVLASPKAKYRLMSKPFQVATRPVGTSDLIRSLGQSTRPGAQSCYSNLRKVSAILCTLSKTL